MSEALELPTLHLPIAARRVVYRREHLKLQGIHGRYGVNSLVPGSDAARLEQWMADQYRQDVAKRAKPVREPIAVDDKPARECRRCHGPIERQVSAGRPAVRCQDCRDAIAGGASVEMPDAAGDAVDD